MSGDISHSSATEISSKVSNSNDFTDIFAINRGIAQVSSTSQKSQLACPKKSFQCDQINQSNYESRSQSKLNSFSKQDPMISTSGIKKSTLTLPNKSINDSQISWQTYQSQVNILNESSQKISNISQLSFKSQAESSSKQNFQPSSKIFDQSIDQSINYQIGKQSNKKQKSVMSQLSTLSIPKKIQSPAPLPDTLIMPQQKQLPPTSHKIAASQALLHDNSFVNPIKGVSSQQFDQKQISDLYMNETSILSSSNISNASSVKFPSKSISSFASSVFQKPKTVISQSTRQITKQDSQFETTLKQPNMSYRNLPVQDASQLCLLSNNTKTKLSLVQGNESVQNSSMYSTIVAVVTQQQEVDINNVINDSKLKIDQLKNQELLNQANSKGGTEIMEAIKLLEIQIIRLQKLYNPQSKRQLIFNALFKIGGQLSK
ncbi:hypothetical protein SS50377_22071 [Spironucleus salmonicida]|uniref:Uncharacterized protein n=1 Tax=Spironucleus salmonicida TaxID=348837 RepID=V6LM51_9EUKA|nr:hypothetical protein SS50377_22071 [Spironucleus salmonicida]|eukprot:EST45767.1 Hypothetical protein SS50377_14338 [Spironucleus salmonicida]